MQNDDLNDAPRKSTQVCAYIDSDHLQLSMQNFSRTFGWFWFWIHPFVFRTLCNLFLIALIMAGSIGHEWCGKMTPILLPQMISRRFQQSGCNNYYHLFHYQNALLRSQHQKIDFTHGGLGYSSQYIFVFFSFTFSIFFFFGCACSFFKKHLGFDIINNVLHPKWSSMLENWTHQTYKSKLPVEALEAENCLAGSIRLFQPKQTHL